MTNKKPGIKRMKGETAKSYDMRTIYMDLPPKERTISKTIEIYYGVTKNDKEYKKLLSQTTNLSSRWLWKQCAEINDAEKRIEQLKKKAEHTDDVNELILKIIEDELYYTKDMLKEVNTAINIKGEEYSLKTKTEMKRNLILNLKDLNEMFRLCSGLSTTNNDVNLKAFMEIESHNNIMLNPFKEEEEYEQELGDLISQIQE